MYNFPGGSYGELLSLRFKRVRLEGHEPFLFDLYTLKPASEVLASWKPKPVDWATVLFRPEVQGR